MSDTPEPIQIPLTPDQQALIKRMSGQHAEMLELTPETDNPVAGAAEGVRFRWRLSVATGIPRQYWGVEGKQPDKEK